MLDRQEIQNVFSMGQTRRSVAIAILVLFLLMAGSSCERINSDTLPSGPTVEPTVPRSVDYPGISEDGSSAIQFYQNVYAWEDYTDAVIHKEEFGIESPNGLAPWIQAIDDDLNAFVTFGGPDLTQGGIVRVDGTVIDEQDRVYHQSDSQSDPALAEEYFPLFEYQIETGAMNELIRLDSYMYPKLLAVSDKYLVWKERAVAKRSGSTAETGPITGDRALHIYVRSTGEDILFTTPLWEEFSWNSDFPSPMNRIVLRDDSLYFDTYNPMNDTDYGVFRFDILSQSLTSFGEMMTNPVLYKERVAWMSWRKAGDVDDERTLFFENDGFAGASDPLILPIPELDGVDENYPSFGILDEWIYVGDRGLGLRMISEKGKQTPILGYTFPAGFIVNLIDSYAGITQWDITEDTFKMYLYNPEESILVRMDDLPSDVMPMKNGQDVISLYGNERNFKSIPVTTTKMMYLTPDDIFPFNPVSQEDSSMYQGTYTLYWFDVMDLGS